jgi:choice-of-anchor C domain-containing protein
MRSDPDWARAVGIARTELRGIRRARRSPWALAGFSGILAAGLHAAGTSASLDAAVDVPSARNREVESMKSSNLAVLAAVLMAGSAASAQNLVVNGGFETGGDLPPCNWFDFHAPSSQLPGWFVDFGSIDHIRTPAKAQCTTTDVSAIEGERCVDLDGVLEAGGISQSIALVPGSVYRLSLQMSGSPYCGGLSKRLRVEVAQIARIFEFTCAPSGQQGWIGHSMEFTATSAQQLLKISSLNGAGCGPIIDAVNIVQLLPCPGDVVENDFVDGADLAAVLGVWGTDGGIYPRADTNGDGVVDGADLATVLGSWGGCP